MQHKAQNQQIDLLTRMALQGGGYSWNSVPISDSSSEDPQFYISNPQEPLRREALSAARRRDSNLLAETHMPTKENVKAAPRNPYRVPAAIVPHEEGEGPGEGISLTNPRPDRFENIAGSGEDEEFLDRLANMSDEELVDMLDRMSRKKRKRSRDERAAHGANRPAGYIGTEGVRRQEEDADQSEGEREQWKKEADRQTSHRVASDTRSAAMDVSAVLPLNSEILKNWHKWLYTKITSQSVQRRNLDRLHEFLAVRGARKYGDLNWQDKEELAEIMRCMVEAEERDEASKAA